jgi:hypothetical protein
MAAIKFTRQGDGGLPLSLYKSSQIFSQCSIFLRTAFLNHPLQPQRSHTSTSSTHDYQIARTEQIFFNTNNMSNSFTNSSPPIDSESALAMTKAQRMMAKMGYTKGLGLGKDGADIVNLIEPEQKLGRKALGFESESPPERSDRHNKRTGTPIKATCKKYDFESKLIYITCLSPHSEPSYIKSLFGSDEDFQEIYAPEESGGNAWVEFKTPDEALASVSRYDGCRFGPNNQKISVDLVPQNRNPASKEFVMRYTDFVRNKNLVPATSTVFVPICRVVDPSPTSMRW